MKKEEASLHFLFFSFQVEIYEDKDNARKDEIAALGGQTATGTNVFSAFYDRLKEVMFCENDLVSAFCCCYNFSD